MAPWEMASRKTVPEISDCPTLGLRVKKKNKNKKGRNVEEKIETSIFADSGKLKDFSFLLVCNCFCLLCFSACRTVSLYSYLSIELPEKLSIIYLCLSLSLCPPCLTIYLSIYLSFHLTLIYLKSYLSIYQSTYSHVYFPADLYHCCFPFCLHTLSLSHTHTLSLSFSLSLTYTLIPFCLRCYTSLVYFPP